MSYIYDRIRLACADPSVAFAAGIEAVKWSTSHVFYFTDAFIASHNIGRLPVITIQELDTEYEHQTQPHHGGTRSSNFNLVFYVRGFQFNPTPARDLMDDMIRAVFRVIRADASALELGNEVRGPFESTPYGFKRTISFTIETSFDNTYSET